MSREDLKNIVIDSLVNKDPNTTTHHLECQECGHQFTTTKDIVSGVDLDEVQTK